MRLTEQSWSTNTYLTQWVLDPVLVLSFESVAQNSSWENNSFITDNICKCLLILLIRDGKRIRRQNYKNIWIKNGLFVLCIMILRIFKNCVGNPNIYKCWNQYVNNYRRNTDTLTYIRKNGLVINFKITMGNDCLIKDFSCLNWFPTASRPSNFCLMISWSEIKIGIIT